MIRIHFAILYLNHDNVYMYELYRGNRGNVHKCQNLEKISFYFVKSGVTDNMYNNLLGIDLFVYIYIFFLLIYICTFVVVVVVVFFFTFLE